ncbi:MAG: isoleucyl-tRNA synthetase, partial [Parcubacteria group bacterium Gr01-1014_106]
LREELNVKDVILRPSEKAEGSMREIPTAAPTPVVERGGDWVRVLEGSRSTTLVTTLTDDLKAEGIVRDLIRHIQGIRKNAGCRFDEQIVVHLDTENTDVRDAVERLVSMLKEETKSTDLRFGRTTVTAEETLDMDGGSVWVGVRRHA